MKQKKPVIVRMNGKQTKANKEKNTAGENINEEHAAAVENTDDATIPAFVRNSDYMQPPQKNKGRSVIKPVVLAVAAAVTVGSVLGLIMLYMFGGITDGGSAGGQPAAGTGTDGTGTAGSAAASDDQNEIEAYVLQGGVFTEQENASVLEERFTEAGFPTVLWERDSQYYLFTGIADTDEQAKRLIESVEGHELDVFAKEWQTEEIKQDFTEKEMSWINSFREQWLATLTTVSNQEQIAAEAWRNLLENKPADSAMIGNVIEEMRSLPGKMEAAGNAEAQQLLLDMWLLYERHLIKNGS